MNKELKRVVVTGMGAITPLGNSVPEFWNGIITGKSGVSMITKFDTSHFKTKFAAEVKGFNASDYFEKNEARIIGRFWVQRKMAFGNRHG